MIRRLVWWWNVLVVSWALRSTDTAEVRKMIDRSFPHRDEEWRDRLYEAARLRNRARVMRKVNA